MAVLFDLIRVNLDCGPLKPLFETSFLRFIEDVDDEVDALRPLAEDDFDKEQLEFVRPLFTSVTEEWRTGADWAVVLAREEVEADMVASLGRDDDLLRRDPEIDFVCPKKRKGKKKKFERHCIYIWSVHYLI